MVHTILSRPLDEFLIKEVDSKISKASRYFLLHDVDGRFSRKAGIYGFREILYGIVEPGLTSNAFPDK